MLPESAEVNPEVYGDVERILFRGFLTVAGEINGVPFVFKSLNHHEFELLRMTGGMYETVGDTPDSFWNRFLAYGVLMVDGANVLSDRERWIPEITTTFGTLPAAAKARVIRYLSEINRRASDAITLTEAYSMEIVLTVPLGAAQRYGPDSGGHHWGRGDAAPGYELGSADVACRQLLRRPLRHE